MVSGDTTLKFTVEKDGTFHDIEVLKKTGHKALHEASVEVIEKLSGMAPLPGDYPLENLQITLTLQDPEWRKPAAE